MAGPGLQKEEWQISKCKRHELHGFGPTFTGKGRHCGFCYQGREIFCYPTKDQIYWTVKVKINSCSDYGLSGGGSNTAKILLVLGEKRQEKVLSWSQLSQTGNKVEEVPMKWTDRPSAT